MNIRKVLKSKKVKVIAPASGFEESKLKSGLKVLKNLGFEADVPRKLKGKHPYLASADSFRWEQLKQAMTSISPSLLWCARGGYGCSRLVDKLHKIKQPEVHKVIVGYSDITWLMHFVQLNWGWKSIHAPLITELGSNKLSNASKINLKRVVVDMREEIEFKSLKPINDLATLRAEISGVLVGGNLTVLQTTLGTSHAFTGQGKIVFFEDCGERGYAVDRKLQHMISAGVFKGCRAVIFGEFTGGNERDGKNYIKTALRDFASSAGFPVFSELPVGHGKNNKPIIIGARATLLTGQKGSLKIKV